MDRDGKGVNPPNYVTGVTGVSECGQQRGNLKGDGYKCIYWEGYIIE